jgi:hypothetical protein
MSFRAKRELLVQVAPRYRAARHGERSVILDEVRSVPGVSVLLSLERGLIQGGYRSRLG